MLRWSDLTNPRGDFFSFSSSSSFFFLAGTGGGGGGGVPPPGSATAQYKSVDEFITRCRVLAAKCKFTDILDLNTRLIEQFIVGTKQVTVQGILPEKRDALASLDVALDIARTYEATKAHVAQKQRTPATAGVVYDVGTRKPKRQDDSCTRCGLDH